MNIALLCFTRTIPAGRITNEVTLPVRHLVCGGLHSPTTPPAHLICPSPSTSLPALLSPAPLCIVLSDYYRYCQSLFFFHLGWPELRHLGPLSSIGYIKSPEITFLSSTLTSFFWRGLGGAACWQVCVRACMFGTGNVGSFLGETGPLLCLCNDAVDIKGPCQSVRSNLYHLIPKI